MNKEKSRLLAICISPGGIPKQTVFSAEVTYAGIAGDGHNHAKHNHPNQAISLEDIETLNDLGQEGFPLSCGTIGENITVADLDVQGLPVGTRLVFSGGVVLELSKERKPCYVLDAIDPRLKEAILGRCGFYAKVIKEGILNVGETIDVVRQEVPDIHPQGELQRTRLA